MSKQLLDINDINFIKSNNHWMTNQEFADRLGISMGTVRNVKKRLGLLKSRPEFKINSAKERAKLIAMLNAGKSVREIMKHFGLSDQAIYWHIKVLGLETPTRRKMREKRYANAKKAIKNGNDRV